MTLRRAAMWAAVAGVLLLVFSAYQRPDMAMTLATRVWSCF